MDSKTAMKTEKITGKTQRAAVTSPLRLEILGLFVSAEPLAISDMAVLMNRTPSSLYHHVGILEQAGLLKKAGTRPKGKRHEALYLPTATRFEYDTSSGDEDSIASAVKVMASGFRMAERDLEAALRAEERLLEGANPEFCAFRVHLRVSPERLAEVNQHLQAVLDLLSRDHLNASALGADDQHVSLTLALLPLKGRDVRQTG